MFLRTYLLEKRDLTSIESNLDLGALKVFSLRHNEASPDHSPSPELALAIEQLNFNLAASPLLLNHRRFLHNLLLLH